MEYLKLDIMGVNAAWARDSAEEIRQIRGETNLTFTSILSEKLEELIK